MSQFQPPAHPPAEPRPLLAVRNLQTRFFGRDHVTRAVDDLSFDIYPGETLGIVGESGCGKSMTALSLMRLLPRAARTVAGKVAFEDGSDLLALDEAAMRRIRGNRIAMIFQEPMTSLNPLLTIGHQIAEALGIHQGLARRPALERAAEMLDFVRIPDARSRLAAYPHQFSGGMRQRVMIAMALVCNPRLLIADEPTTALDVTIQAQILGLMRELKTRSGTAIMLITHDLGVVAETCQRVIVMYAGRKIEEAPVIDLFDHPAHPYTRGLMTAVPRLGDKSKRRLTEIPGLVPSLRDPITGCAFAPRCARADSRCRSETPELRPIAGAHLAACHHAEAVMSA